MRYHSDRYVSCYATRMKSSAQPPQERLPMVPTRTKRGTPRSRKAKRGSKIIAVVALFVIGSAAIGISKELIHRYQVNRDIRLLEEEIARLENQNSDLSYLVDYLNTDAFKDIQARQNLGLQQPGETAVLIESPDDIPTLQHDMTGLEASATSSLQAALDESLPTAHVPQEVAQSSSVVGSRVRSWWKYFFAPDQVLADEPETAPEEALEE